MKAVKNGLESFLMFRQLKKINRNSLSIGTCSDKAFKNE